VAHDPKHDAAGHAHPRSWKDRLERLRFCNPCGGELVWKSPAPAQPERLTCSACGEVQFLNPKVAAGTLIVVDARIVLLRRAIEPGYGLWTFPGGFVDLGETAQEAAARETMEEAGLRVAVGGPAGVYTSDARDIIIIVFWASVTGGSLCAADECLEARLFHPSEIPWSDLAFSSTRKLLAEHFPRQPPATPSRR